MAEKPPPDETHEEWLARMAQHRPTSTQRTGRGKARLSDAAKHTPDGELLCPKCGGAQFTAKRSMTGKVVGFSTLGVGGLLAPKTRVKCIACGTTFKRG